MVSHFLSVFSIHLYVIRSHPERVCLSLSRGMFSPRNGTVTNHNDSAV